MSARVESSRRREEVLASILTTWMRMRALTLLWDQHPRLCAFDFFLMVHVVVPSMIVLRTQSHFSLLLYAITLNQV